ncbi:porin [Collimonas antrihumi]|uniref:porin n=1 Tax=Collimonas antrihumi TaxID=1940615 RepID=UPI001B8AA208|nr:porin [Collimonas antrihumi]
MINKKQVAILGAAAALCGTASAQTSNVQIYGLIDTTISHINHADAKGNSLTGFQVPWFSGSRWGLRGTEDVGNGLNVVFKLESEFVTQTGEMDTPGVLFNRDAWVGFTSNDLGKLTFGRQNAVGRDVSGIYSDPYTSEAVSTEETGYTNTNNFKQLVFYAGSATGTRMDNGVVWKKLWDGKFLTAVGYQFGEVPGSFSKNTSVTGAVGYNGSNYHLSAYVVQANQAGFTDRSYSLGGNVILGDVRLNAGYYRYKGDQGILGNRTDNAYTVSAKYAPRGAFDYELGYQIIKAHNAAFSASGSTLNPFANVALATATGSGKKSTIYGSAFYHISKRTEFYVAADYMKLNDQYVAAQSNGFRNQTELAMGMRTRF